MDTFTTVTSECPHTSGLELRAGGWELDLGHGCVSLECAKDWGPQKTERSLSFRPFTQLRPFAGTLTGLSSSSLAARASLLIPAAIY